VLVFDVNRMLMFHLMFHQPFCHALLEFLNFYELSLNHRKKFTNNQNFTWPSIVNELLKIFKNGLEMIMYDLIDAVISNRLNL
jgi:coproporphyrinogen III oxidase-like Fe-S oxidoreductase